MLLGHYSYPVPEERTIVIRCNHSRCLDYFGKEIIVAGNRYMAAETLTGKAGILAVRSQFVPHETPTQTILSMTSSSIWFVLLSTKM
jgi:hypothetical protein